MTLFNLLQTMTMNVPAWHIVAWPHVDITLARWKNLKGFQFLGLSSRHDDEGRLLGNTLWASDEAGSRVGLAWEWCELSTNVFVMSDPMSVMSNAALADGKDRKTNQFQRLLHLNNTIYRLPWQKHLRSVIRPAAQTDVIALQAAT